MPFKVCEACEQGIKVDEDKEEFFNYCTTCGKPLILVPEEEVNREYDLYED